MRWKHHLTITENTLAKGQMFGSHLLYIMLGNTQYLLEHGSEAELKVWSAARFGVKTWTPEAEGCQESEEFEFGLRATL